MAQFAKFLPLYGWTPYVLTIKDTYLSKLDSSGLGGINPENIYKTAKLPTCREVYSKVKNILGSGNRKHPSPDGGEDIDENSTGSGQENRVQKLKRFFISLLIVPDIERNWIFPAVFKAIREIKRQKIDCILTSSPPYSVHLAGLLVKKMTGVAWIADFRDPWTSAGPKRVYLASSLSKKIEKWMERQVIGHADRVLTTTENLSDNLKQTYPGQDENKFVHITNGYDPELTAQSRYLPKYDIFTVAYTGTLYLGRTPEPVFKAVQELAQEGRIDLQKIQIKLVGSCRSIGGRPIERIADAYGLASRVEVVDTVPYLTALAIVRQSHLALLLAPDQPFQIPAKVFDYIGVGTHILAVTGKGATRDLISSTGAGTAFLPTDICGIKEFIRRAISNGNCSGKDNSAIEPQFDRRSIVKILANQLDKITKKVTPRPAAMGGISIYDRTGTNSGR